MSRLYTTASRGSAGGSASIVIEEEVINDMEGSDTGPDAEAYSEWMGEANAPLREMDVFMGPDALGLGNLGTSRPMRQRSSDIVTAKHRKATSHFAGRVLVFRF